METEKMTLFLKSRKRITSTSLLCYINGLVTLIVFYVLKQKIGGHVLASILQIEK